MSIKKSANHKYDYVIVGGGLSGLLMAASLSRFTENIALLEGQDTFGGFNRSIQFPTGPINNGLRFVPASQSSESALLFLENLLGLKIIGETLDVHPQTYDSGHMKNFLGFGDHPPEFYEEFQYFLASQKTTLKVEPSQWPTLLFNEFKGDYLPRSYVTKFLSENEHITGVMVNGAKIIHAENVIYCGSIKDLAILLPEEAVSVRARQRLSKSPYWTALCIDLCHSHAVTENPLTHVLNGTTQDEIGPCVGTFLPAVTLENGETLQASQWLTFIDEESTEDTEVVGHALKKIKRQIKRAYPEAMDNLKSERILVAPMLGGNGEIKLNADQSLPHLPNLWIASGPANPVKNLLGALLQAQMVITALGFEITPKNSVFVCPDESPVLSEVSN